jgi:hypothetical protein
MGDQFDFESIIAELTQPINGQYPHPWMTTLIDPTLADVFVVGRNQAKTFPADMVGGHQRYLDALFNRNGQSCRKLYDEASGGIPSPTRKNIDSLVRCLKGHGVPQILETNVICYSTPLSRDLRLPQHIGGSKQGETIFRMLLHYVKPRVLIVHGSGATEQLARMLRAPIPNPNKDSLLEFRIGDQLIVVIPSLAPPAFNTWSQLATEVFENVANCVARELGHSIS